MNKIISIILTLSTIYISVADDTKIVLPAKSPISLLEVQKHFSNTLGTRYQNNISDKMSLDLMLENQDIVMLKFYADWCPPCREWAPIVKQAAKQYKNCSVIEVNIEKHPAIAKKYGVSRIPVGIYFANGKQVARSSGNLSLKETCSYLDRAVKSL